MTYTYSSHPYSQDFNVKTFDNLRLEGSFTVLSFQSVRGAVQKMLQYPLNFFWGGVP